ncbi:MAG: ParA family protein, partial [Prevotella sp.]
LLANCDAIVIPFSYEKTCVNSTNSFLDVLAATCKRIGRPVPKLFFLPNVINRRWGNKKELEAKERLNERYNSIGTVLPMIAAGVEMQRNSTLYITPRQKEMVSRTFNALIEGIDNDTKNDTKKTAI